MVMFPSLHEDDCMLNIEGSKVNIETTPVGWTRTNDLDLNNGTISVFSGVWSQDFSSAQISSLSDLKI